MKRYLPLVLFSVLLQLTAIASHIKGGFFTYKYIGTQGNTLQYHITLTVYMVCIPNSGQLDSPINFSFFDGVTSKFIKNVSVPITQQFTLLKSRDEKCISGDQRGCYYYIVIYDLPSVDLDLSANGYTVSYQRCCRIDGMQNIEGSSSVGNTWSITIPGTARGADQARNSSPIFPVNDTIVVCAGSQIQWSFKATDPDGDSLNYFFCNAWSGGDAADPAPGTATSPPYQTVPYHDPYSGDEPMGSNIKIDLITGLISGTVPAKLGEYVITVCVAEIRNGDPFAFSRKELHVRVGDCIPIKASLQPQYINCDSLTVGFTNLLPSPDITSNFWDFGVPGVSNDTSNLESPAFTYPDTGTFTLKYVVNRGQDCRDSSTAQVRIYPGYFPGFSFDHICVNKPTQFNDTTRAKYGIVDSWRWEFGIGQTTADTSILQNPVFTYTDTGTYQVQLIVGSSKGCNDTTTKSITIFDKPPLHFAFRDTLICNGDKLQLQAKGDGSFRWTPGVAIVNANTATPTVSPPVTTIYKAQLDDNGCVNQDSLRVRVVDFVTIQAFPDTLICQGDSIQLHTQGDALHFLWTPSANMSDPTAANPVVKTDNTTNYQVTGIIGHCTTDKQVNVITVPYPLANAGQDTIICYGMAAQLNGSTDASTFTWQPGGSLSNPFILDPLASPRQNTVYILTVTDNKGCPKPVRDSVFVMVRAKINALAGDDTAVVVGQPLQLNASGGISYLWSPVTGLNNPAIPNPVGIYDGSEENIRYTVVVGSEDNCIDSAFVNVKVFKTTPQVFVPTAFSPNGDGINDIFRPIGVGIKTIEYFRIYDRWGQLVFSTTKNGDGWDGKINGKLQGSNAFVWIVKGVDYLGHSFFKKGTVTLIR